MLRQCLLDKIRPSIIYSPDMQAAVQNARFTAQRFIFDEAASERVGAIMQYDTALVAHNIEFARPAFDPMYIEVEGKAVWRGRGGKNAPRAYRIGYLFVGEWTYVLIEVDGVEASGLRPKDDVLLGIIAYRLNKPQVMPHCDIWSTGGKLPWGEFLTHVFILGGNKDEVEAGVGAGVGAIFPDLMRGYKGEAPWLCRGVKGEYIDVDFSSGEPIKRRPVDRKWLATLANFCAGIDVRRVASPLIKDDGVAVVLKDYAFASGGDPLLAAAALLLLNYPNEDKVEIAYVPAKRAMVSGGKSAAFMEHKTVHINLQPHERARHATTLTERGPPRRHGVRGHWVHRHKDAACEHQWLAVDSTDRRFSCFKCGELKSWKRQHERGDASKGRIEHDYKVHALASGSQAAYMPHDEVLTHPKRED